MFQTQFSWRREYLYLLLFLVPFIWLLSLQFPASGSADAIFEPLPNSLRTTNLDAEVIRQGQLQFNPAALASRSSAPINLTLFDDLVVTADHRRTDQFKNGGQVWVGNSADSPFSQILLSWNGPLVSGHIQNEAGLFRIFPDPTNKNIHIVEQLTGVFPPGAEPVEPDFEAAPYAIEHPIVTGRSPNNPTEINILVVYSAAAKNEVGGSGAMENLINMAVAQTNDSYANSDVNINLNLAHQQEIAFTESGSSASNLEADLNTLRSNSEVQSIRDDVQADLVTLIRKDAGSFCGIAYVMKQVSPEFESLAYSLITHTCAVANLSFAHETGHNFGAQHDRNNAAANSGAHQYSHGYQHTGSGSFRTVMAYQGGCPWPCTRIPYWSNNNKFYQGNTTGVDYRFSNSAANYFTLNNTAPIVEDFREPPATPTPTATNTPTNTPTPTPTNTPTNTPTPTPTFTPTPLPTIVATAPPNVETVLSWQDFRFDFPSGTFTDTVEITILALNPADLPDQPEDSLDTTSYQYQVSAVNLETRAPMDLVLGQDFTVTILYDDLGIRRVKEQTLGLFYWDPAETNWVLAANQEFVENTRISADGTSLTYFAVLGEKTEKAFFPFISKPFP